MSIHFNMEIRKTKSLFYLICNTNRYHRKEQDYARLCLDEIIVNNLASDPFSGNGIRLQKIDIEMRKRGMGDRQETRERGKREKLKRKRGMKCIV